MKKFRRQDGFSEIELFHAAADHLASAKILFEQSPRCLDSAGYLSHLGIELLLKALLLSECSEFPNEHSLVVLKEQLEKHGAPISCGKDHEATLNLLETFYELRYPRTQSPIEIGSDDWEGIERLFEFIVFLFPSSLQEQFRDLDHTQKGNRILMKKPVST